MKELVVVDLQSEAGWTCIKKLIAAAWSDLPTLKLYLHDP